MPPSKFCISFRSSSGARQTLASGDGNLIPNCVRRARVFPSIHSRYPFANTRARTCLHSLTAKTNMSHPRFLPHIKITGLFCDLGVTSRRL